MGVTLTVGGRTIALSVKAASVTLSTYVPGPKGDKGDSFFELPTNSDIGGNRAVGTVSGFTAYADCSASVVAVGLSMGATQSGINCKIQTWGKMVVTGAGWTPNAPVFLSVNGTLTQVEPVHGFSQVVGIAHDSETLLINIEKPINLA